MLEYVPNRTSICSPRNGLTFKYCVSDTAWLPIYVKKTNTTKNRLKQPANMSLSTLKMTRTTSLWGRQAKISCGLFIKLLRRMHSWGWRTRLILIFILVLRKFCYSIVCSLLCLHVHVLVSMSVHQFVLFVSLSLSLFACVPVSLFGCFSVCLSVLVSLSVHIRLYV